MAISSFNSPSPSPASDAPRPTLPPLHSLCLPDIRNRKQNPNVPAMHFMNNANSNDLLQTPLPLDFNQHWPRGRQSSISSTTSSCTTSSRASSPTDAWSASRSAPSRRTSICTRTIRRQHPYLPSDKYRVVLSDNFDNADAMLVLPLPSELLDENNDPIPERLKKYKSKGKAYLVVGPLAHELRDPTNRARLRAAVHPYRFVLRNPQETQQPIATPTLPFPLRPASIPSVSDADMQ